MKLHRVLLLAPVVLVGCGQGGSSGPAPLTVHSTFTVPAGQELTKCLVQHLNNAVPYDFSHVESHMAPGSHHTILYTDASYLVPGSTPPVDGLYDCNMSEPRLYVYGAQTPDHSVDLPVGVAGQLPAQSVVILEAHYVNASSSAITADVTISMAPMTEPIKYYGGTLFYLDDAFSIPPGAGINGAAPYSHTTTCGVPSDPSTPTINIFRLGSHTHHRGLTVDIEETAPSMKAPLALYHSANWNLPVEVSYPDTAPLVMGGADAFTFTCSWDNETTSPITFGPSALNNEMCIIAAGYYPRVNGPYNLGGVVFCHNGTLYY